MQTAVPAAAGSVGARGADGLTKAEPFGSSRRVGGVLHHATEIVRARGADGAAALRHRRAGEILGIDGAADAEAVEVAVAHVTERQSVEGLPDLARTESTNGDAVRPFVTAPGIGALHVHAGELLHDFERARSGGAILEIRLADRVGSARLIATGWRGDDGNGSELSDGVLR